MERLEEMAVAMVQHLESVCAMSATSSPHLQLLKDAVSVERILEGIHVFRVHSCSEQLAVVNCLQEFLEEHPNVKLVCLPRWTGGSAVRLRDPHAVILPPVQVVFDSVTFHFRHDFKDLALRSRLLHGMAQTLAAVASAKDVAVLCPR